MKLKEKEGREWKKKEESEKTGARDREFVYGCSLFFRCFTSLYVTLNG